MPRLASPCGKQVPPDAIFQGHCHCVLGLVPPKNILIANKPEHLFPFTWTSVWSACHTTSISFSKLSLCCCLLHRLSMCVFQQRRTPKYLFEHTWISSLSAKYLGPRTISCLFCLSRLITEGSGSFRFHFVSYGRRRRQKKDLGSALNLCNEVYHSNGSHDYKHCDRGCLYILYDHHPTAVLVCSKQQRYQPRTKLIDKATSRWT